MDARVSPGNAIVTHQEDRQPQALSLFQHRLQYQIWAQDAFGYLLVALITFKKIMFKIDDGSNGPVFRRLAGRSVVPSKLPLNSPLRVFENWSMPEEPFPTAPRCRPLRARAHYASGGLVIITGLRGRLGGARAGPSFVAQRSREPQGGEPATGRHNTPRA